MEQLTRDILPTVVTLTTSLKAKGAQQDGVPRPCG